MRLRPRHRVRVRGRQSQWCVLICLIGFPLDGASQRPTGKPQSASAILHMYFVCTTCVCILFVCILCILFVCAFSLSLYLCVYFVYCVCALYNFCHSHLLLQLLLLRDVAGVAAFVTGDKQTDEGLGVVNNNNCCLDSM